MRRRERRRARTASAVGAVEVIALAAVRDGQQQRVPVLDGPATGRSCRQRQLLGRPDSVIFDPVNRSESRGLRCGHADRRGRGIVSTGIARPLHWPGQRSPAIGAMAAIAIA